MIDHDECRPRRCGAATRTGTAPPLPRVTAFALDAVTYLIIPALLLPLGQLLVRHGVMLSSVAINASRSLARHMIRIALPWESGHTVALGYAYAEGGNVPVWSVPAWAIAKPQGSS
jgi:hypothetical protein